MAAINIDGPEYQTEELSTGARNNLGSLQFVQNEIKRLEAQIAVYKTAEVGYVKGLKAELEASE